MTNLSRRGSDASRVRPPLQQGRLVRLAILEPKHYDALYAISTDAQTGFRWRHKGTIPSPERFVQSLWEGVLAQFVVERRDTGQVVGQVVAYDANVKNRFAWIAVAGRADEMGSGRMMEATALFIDWLFAMWDFHKLYAESLEYNYAHFASGEGDVFRLEGRLREHEYYDGKRWDLLQIAVYRRDWSKSALRLSLPIRGLES